MTMKLSEVLILLAFIAVTVSSAAVDESYDDDVAESKSDAANTLRGDSGENIELPEINVDYGSSLDMKSPTFNKHSLMTGWKLTQCYVRAEPNIGVEALPSVVEDANCDTGDVTLTKIGNEQYFIENSFKNDWHAAAKFCQDHNMQLLSIDTPEKQRSLEQYFKEQRDDDRNWWFWIDGSFDSKLQRWTWTTNNTPVQNYVPQVNKERTGFCLYTFREGPRIKFSDWDCKRWLGPFICETKSKC